MWSSHELNLSSIEENLKEVTCTICEACHVMRRGPSCSHAMRYLGFGSSYLSVVTVLKLLVLHAGSKGTRPLADPNLHSKTRPIMITLPLRWYSECGNGQA